jgi:ribosomal protein L34E
MPAESNATMITIPRLSGKYKQVRITFLGVPSLRTEGRASQRFPDENFGIYVLDELFTRQSILSKRRGVLRKTHHCRKCDASLMGLKAHRRRFALTMKYKQTAPFKVEIEMPAMTCPECATNNAVNDEGTQHVVGLAIAKAFESLKVRK